jgi:hypothetical protein
MSPGNAPRVVASDWYAANVGDDWAGLSGETGGGAIRRALARTRPGRGLLIHRAARRAAGAALIRNERGALTALWLAALTRRGAIVLLEMIPNRPPRSGWKRALSAAWFRLVEGPAVRHGMRAGQAMSAVETESLAAMYDLPPERFPHVPWALSRTAAAEFPPAAERSGVLASGRAACDWETLFAAATPEWELTVVCAGADHARVAALAAAAGTAARILSEITRDEHDELMRRAAVYAMPLTEDRLSSGQVRLQTATELGAPVVVSAISTLAEYVLDGETAVEVPVGEPEALRAAVDSLVADPARRDRLARASLDRARARTYPDYFREVKEFVERELAPRRALRPGAD